MGSRSLAKNQGPEECQEGEKALYDYGLGTLEQYGVVSSASVRTRGALLCHTDKGLLILKEFRGSEKKLKIQQRLLLHLREEGCLVDVYLPNQEGELVTRDKDDIPYTVQHWYEGRECDTKSREDIQKGVGALACIHHHMSLPLEEGCQARSLKEEYSRHNQEIRRIRKYIRNKGGANAFEKDFLGSVQWFLEKGEEAEALLADSGYDKLKEQAQKEGLICHGEYSQHNVLVTRSGCAVTNFDHFAFDTHMTDLYRFMRKILEKHNWDIRLAREMLETYNKKRPISKEEWEHLKIRFTYPEKYWKLANYYFSHKKSWISEKNVEKQRRLIEQREKWGDFARGCFG